MQITDTVDVLELIRGLVSCVGLILAIWAAYNAKNERRKVVDMDILPQDRRSLMIVANWVLSVERLFVFLQMCLVWWSVQAMTLPPSPYLSESRTLFNNIIYILFSLVITSVSVYGRISRIRFENNEKEDESTTTVVTNTTETSVTVTNHTD